MRVGTICYAIQRGLGHLARDFHRHGVITDVLALQHSKIPTEWDWYPKDSYFPWSSGTLPQAREFVRGLDAVLFFETPYFWELVPFCRAHGVRAYLVTMMECFPRQFHGNPTYAFHKYICPSDLDVDYFPGGVRLNLPVEYPWRRRGEANHFVHNGGYLGIKGREGTCKLIDALPLVKSSIKLTIRVQENVPADYQIKMAADRRVEYVPETVPYHDLYGTGEVCVGAQRWNGCSLPLQEAFASGMLVMNTNRHPTNTWLPREPLIPVDHVVRDCVSGAYLTVDASEVTPQAIAETVDAWYGKDVGEYSLRGKAWAEANSWDALKPRWLEVLSS